MIIKSKNESGDVDMKIENLRYFLALARTENMKRAAEEQFLTRQNLNIIIKNIETELNMQLFTRTNKGTVLNQNGKLFAKAAQQIVDIYDTFLKEQQPRSNMFLEIYTTPVLSYIIKNLIEDVAAEGCFLSVQEYRFEELSKMITGNQTGIYLIPISDSDKLRYLRERKDKILLAQDKEVVVVCHKDHPLAKMDINEQELLQYPMIAPGDIEKSNTWLNINDISICKKLMRLNQALYQSSSFFVKSYFSDEDEWCMIKSVEDWKMEYVVFANVTNQQQLKLFHTILYPKLKKMFQL